MSGEAILSAETSGKLCPNPAGGAHGTSPDPPSRWEGVAAPQIPPHSRPLALRPCLQRKILDTPLFAVDKLIDRVIRCCRGSQVGHAGNWCSSSQPVCTRPATWRTSCWARRDNRTGPRRSRTAMSTRLRSVLPPPTWMRMRL